MHPLWNNSPTPNSTNATELLLSPCPPTPPPRLYRITGFTILTKGVLSKRPCSIGKFEIKALFSFENILCTACKITLRQSLCWISHSFDLLKGTDVSFLFQVFACLFVFYSARALCLHFLCSLANLRLSVCVFVFWSEEGAVDEMASSPPIAEDRI